MTSPVAVGRTRRARPSFVALPAAAVLLAALALALVAVPAAAVTTYTGFVLDSEPGMTFGGGQLFDQDPGVVTGLMDTSTGVARATLTGGEWSFQFRAAADAFLVGRYAQGVRGGFVLLRNGVNCIAQDWTFNTLELPETSGTTITRFSADFLTRCGTQQRVLHGSIRIGSALPTSLLRISGTVNLPDTIVGEVSDEFVITVSNEGGVDVALTDGTLGGTNPDQFQAEDACGTVSLDPGQNCEVRIRFAPTSTTAKSATWTIPNSTWEPNRIARMAGIGRSPLTLLPSTITSYAHGGTVPAGYAAISPATFTTSNSSATAVHLATGPWVIGFNGGGGPIVAGTATDLDGTRLNVAYNHAACDGPGSVTVLDPPVLDTDGALLQFSADITISCGTELRLWVRFHAPEPVPPQPNPWVAPQLSAPTAQAGDTITVDPKVSGVALLTRIRCSMTIEGFQSQANWVRMQAAGDDCAPWTFTLPPSTPGTYFVSTNLYYDDAGFGNATVFGQTLTIDVVAGGSPTPFTSNYPVQSWAIEDMLSDATPDYGTSETLRAPDGADGCQLRIFAGYEAAWTTQYDACVDWTFKIPAPTGNAVVPILGSRADAAMYAWTGQSDWTDDRIDVPFRGARWGATYRGSVPDFGGTTAGAYASNLPAVFSNDLRNRVYYVDEPGPYAYTPVVVGAPAGSVCHDNRSVQHAVSGGACGTFQIPDWTSTSNGSATGAVELRDAGGRPIAGTDADMGFAQHLGTLGVVAPAAAELGSGPDVGASTAAGLPAAWTITITSTGGAASAAVSVTSVAPAGAAGEGLHTGTFAPDAGRNGNTITIPDLDLPIGSYDIDATFTDVRGATTAASDSIVIQDTKGPTGTVAISDGAGYTTSSGVTIAVPAQDPSGVTHVALSNDGSAWVTRTYGASQAWTLPTTNGTRKVWVKWRDGLNHWSAPTTDTIVLDTVKPSASGVGATFRTGGTVASGSVPLRVAWSGKDATSGIARYELAQSTNGGAWASVSTSLTTASASRSLAPGSTYRFRVRPVDRAGNTGPWAYGTTFNVSAAQQTSSRISWSGTWRTSSSSTFWGGSTRYATAAGAKATFKVTGRTFAWVAAVGPTRGSAQVYVNGVLVKTVSLYASTGATQRVAFTRSWSTSATRTITIKVTGTSGRPRVDVDAIAWGS